tara:strand:- start:491 stop:694 length:204 start_codon:yes stop_codon:yes gene_type:complete
MKCIICRGDIEPHVNAEGVIYWTEGHNAEPIGKGRCCNRCNEDIVIPARMTELQLQVLNKMEDKKNG